MRRFSCAYQIDPVATTTDANGTLVRTHTVTMATVAAYVEARKAAKSAKKSASKSK